MNYLSKIVLMLVLLLANVNANGKMTIEEFCELKPCRKNLTIKLKQKDGSLFERSFKLLPPAVQPSFISIYAGETIYIEANEGEVAPTDFVRVKKIKHPNRTMTIELKQQKLVGNGTSMWLKVNNPFSKDIRYRIGMMPLSENQLFKTSSCPVMAKKNVIETWPFPIFQIVISGIHFLKDNDNGECK